MRLEIIFKDGRKEIFDGVESFNVTEEQEKFSTPKVAKMPTEGKFFEVNPLGIDRTQFEKTMSDPKQEKTRQMILEAFSEVDKHPIRYASKFYTLIPKKCWEDDKGVVELEAYATNLGGQMADWVEQSMEWAQRINNGESWGDLCNDADTANWYRVVRGKFNQPWRIGGLRGSSRNNWPANVYYDIYRPALSFDNAVPLVVFKT